MAQHRPSMQARNSSGKQISLLNNEDTEPRSTRPYNSHDDPYRMARSLSSNTTGSTHSSPRTPALERADSYDSHTYDPSPVTPTSPREYGRPPLYIPPGVGYKQEPTYDRPALDSFSTHLPNQYPVAPQALVGSQYEDTRSSLPSQQSATMYDENNYSCGATADRGSSGKRYPCRYRDSHGCEKTFTTSGHASRHSKIHTAEKGVSCTFEGCPKKFTRADNMKQHFDTHYKDKNRTKLGLARASGVRKPSRPSSRAENHTPVDATNRAVDASFAPFAPYPQMASQATQTIPPYQERRESSSPLTTEMEGLDVLAEAATHRF